jgi:membrane-bound lytic murein transglycosylase A
MNRTSMSIKRIILLASATAVVISLAACTSTVKLEPATPTGLPPIGQQTNQPTNPQTTPQPGRPAPPPDIFKVSSFAALPGWERDDLREAWAPFLASCVALNKKADWKEICTIAHDVNATDAGAIRTFFEAFLLPYQVINPDGSDHGLVTGYYEPLLRGARKRGGPYQTALYRVPEDLITIDLASVYPELKNMRLRGRLAGNKLLPYPSRAEMEASNQLAGKELCWVDDPIEAFFLQVQGSGRVQFADGKETVRVAYADQNGHPYKSIGRYLVDKGELKLEQASMQGIRSWVSVNPGRQQELLNANPSYVFFKEEKLADPKVGPKGALGVALQAQRSIAVDTQFLPLGAPVFLATTQPNSDVPLQRLVMAQDTGGAIRGAIRADFFWGFGAEAGEKAGRMKQRGMLWVLLPKLSTIH